MIKYSSGPKTACRLFAGQPQSGFSGFSLLELMLVLALITVLTAMAVPSYQQYVQRSHRANAMELLVSAANCQQKIYAAEVHYDTRRCLPADPSGRYEFRLEPEQAASTTVFSVLAAPMGSQQNDPCGELVLDQSGLRSISGAIEIQRKCWEGR